MSRQSEDSGNRPERGDRPTRAEVLIRPLGTQEDFRASAELQRRTWGAEFVDVVPPHLMNIVQRIGGVAAGAFDASGALLGFVFGITGVRNGRSVHWSDMLAVRPESRGLGIGRQLKQFQRCQLLEVGVAVIEWSFDPLVARNAHLNLVRLGATVRDYVVNMYGESTDHRDSDGFGTDRLIVSWSISDASELPLPEFGQPDSGVLNTSGSGSLLSPSPGSGSSDGRIRIAIPLDIHELRSGSPEQARDWRASTRASFLSAISNRYGVTTFETDRENNLGWYVLRRHDVESAT